eukprot:scaffold489786_cov43-Prasinocladus_malaysianus.AAC.1
MCPRRVTRGSMSFGTCSSQPIKVIGPHTCALTVAFSLLMMHTLCGVTSIPAGPSQASDSWLRSPKLAGIDHNLTVASSDADSRLSAASPANQVIPARIRCVLHLQKAFIDLSITCLLT